MPSDPATLLCAIRDADKAIDALLEREIIVRRGGDRPDFELRRAQQDAEEAMRKAVGAAVEWADKNHPTREAVGG